MLLSSPWAPFYYRTRRARFVRRSLCQDLSPVEWLLRKMGENLHMQTATWLMSRELAEAAGPWDTRLHYDDDGEYFCRVLLASEGTRFVPGTGVFYRVTASNRVSSIGNSDKKKESLLRSMKLHIQYLRSLEESERVRKACLTYMQNWYRAFYPERPDLVAELQGMAAELQGRLEPPRLRWKYAWMEPMFGWKAAKWAQTALPQLKSSCIRHCDKAMYRRRGAPKGRAHCRPAGLAKERLQENSSGKTIDVPRGCSRLESTRDIARSRWPCLRAAPTSPTHSAWQRRSLRKGRRLELIGNDELDCPEFHGKPASDLSQSAWRSAAGCRLRDEDCPGSRCITPGCSATLRRRSRESFISCGIISSNTSIARC